jgi:hypothetical protein
MKQPKFDREETTVRSSVLPKTINKQLPQTPAFSPVNDVTGSDLAKKQLSVPHKASPVKLT